MVIEERLRKQVGGEVRDVYRSLRRERLVAAYAANHHHNHLVSGAGCSAGALVGSRPGKQQTRHQQSRRVQEPSLGWVCQGAGINHELGAPLRGGAKSVLHKQTSPGKSSWSAAPFRVADQVLADYIRRTLVYQCSALVRPVFRAK